MIGRSFKSKVNIILNKNLGGVMVFGMVFREWGG